MTNKEDFIKAGFEVIDSSENKNQNQLLEFLKKHYPQTIKDGELKLNELKNALEIAVDEKNNGYGLNFIGRNYAKAKYLQKTSKELKINQNLSKNFDETGNVIIKGDNLDSLKILLNSYRGKIKCIYIDPPYNTKNEGFIYPDKFDREELEAMGFENISDDDFQRMEFSFSNKSSHNGWLSFMYPRLKLARDLLTDDGVIFVSIDDNEQANLKILMDEIFGEEEFVGILIWKKTENIKMDSKFFSENKDYLLCYKKEDLKEFNKILSTEERYNLEDEKGKYYLRKLDGKNGYTKSLDYIIENEGKSYYAGGSYDKWKKRQEIGADEKDPRWLWSKTKFEEGLKNNEIVFKNENVYNKVRYDGIAKKPYTDFLIIKSGQYAQKALDKLFEGKRIFDHPKPVELLTEILKMTSTSEDDTILDFFAGSGTTAQAVMELNKEDGGNRKFILCQIDEPIDEKKKKEAYDFCIKNNLPPVISSITIERVKRAGEKILTEIVSENSKKSKQTDLLNCDNSLTKNQNLDIGFKTFDSIETSQIVENNAQLTLQISNSDSLSKIYHLILKDGVFDLNAKIKTIIENCLYLVENQTYYIINASNLEIEENKKILSKILEDKNKNFKIDGFTASINLTLQQYQNKNRFKIIY